MTESEAIKKAIRYFECMKNDAVVVLDSGFGTHPGESDLVYRNRKMYAELAINALEKQIPKKPNKTIDSSWGTKKEVHVCPICDYYLTEVQFIASQKIESNKKITYCETCGQAIDWRDEE